MTNKELQEIIELHSKWLRGEKGRKKADLSSADLSSADLRYADLRYANLSYADLRYANLRYADLSSADLRYANLRYADLCSANLRSADLRSADLRYANLRSADLRYANLRSTKGLSRIWQSDLSILKCQEGKLIAYKYLSQELISPYKGFQYEVGKTYSEKDCDDNEFNECGKGLNVATLDWCLRDTNCDLQRIYVEVDFEVKDIVVIPFASNGKFRVKKMKITRKLSKKEIENYIKTGKLRR